MIKDIESFLNEMHSSYDSENEELGKVLKEVIKSGFEVCPGKNYSNLHFKSKCGINFGCFTKTGRFRNYSSRLCGEPYQDKLGHLLGVEVYKEGSDHFWTIREGKSKSVCISALLPFYLEWIALLKKEVYMMKFWPFVLSESPDPCSPKSEAQVRSPNPL